MAMDELKALCVQMRALQATKDEQEDALKITNAALDELRLKKIPELMAEMEVTTATWPGLGRVQLASDLYASTREGQKELAMQWLRDCGYEGLIQETYNASSIKAIFRKMIVEGAEIPGDIFSVTPFTRASIVKA